MKIVCVKRRNPASGEWEKGPPICEAMGRKLSRTLSATLYHWTGDNGIEYRLLVKSGFVFDGASIPRLLWTFCGLSPHGVMDGPALPHDLGYHCRGEFDPDTYQSRSLNGQWYDCSVPMTKTSLDNLLHALCLYFGIGKYRSWLVWSGVSVGGWLAWTRDDGKRKLKTIDKLAKDIQGETP